MFKEVKTTTLLAISALLIICSCGVATSDNSDNDSIKAEKMLGRANEAFRSGDAQTAIELIDSIDSVYVKQVSVRRKAMALKPQVKELLIMREIQVVDSLLATYELNNTSPQDIYVAQVRKENLERQLQVARNQAVRMSDDAKQ